MKSKGIEVVSLCFGIIFFIAVLVTTFNVSKSDRPLLIGLSVVLGLIDFGIIIHLVRNSNNDDEE